MVDIKSEGVVIKAEPNSRTGTDDGRPEVSQYAREIKIRSFTHSSDKTSFPPQLRKMFMIETREC